MRCPPLAVLALVAALPQLACTERNPLFCQSNADCGGDPSRPFCDVTGAFGDMVGNRCIGAPQDAGDTCEASSECLVAGQPICDPQVELCRACDREGGDAECRERDDTAGVCASDGRCVECEVSVDCAASGPPICSGETCMACTEDAAGDAACAARGDGLDYCSGGACVACGDDSHCPTEAPVCDDTSKTCRTCADHDECDSEVCHPDNGQCTPADTVVYVAANGTDSLSCGTSAAPCRSVSDSNGALSKLDATIRTVKARAGNYVESVWVRNGETVTIVGAGDNTVFTPPSGNSWPGLWVSNSSNATVIDAVFANAVGGSTADGARCESSATMRLVRVRVRNNQAMGVDGDDCTAIRIERSTIESNDFGGVSIRDSGFALTNNFIFKNGDVQDSTFGGVEISNSGSFSPQTFEHNTVASNQAQSNTPTGVGCTNSTIRPRWNIVWGGVTSGTLVQVAGNCVWNDNDIQGGFAGNNMDVDPQFINPNPSVADFRLMGTSLLEGAATGSTLGIDHEDDSRPQGSGPDIGADEIAP